MNKSIANNIIRFFLITLLQVFLFKRISLNLGDFTFVHFLLYPMIILLLPFKTPKTLVVLISFAVGIIIDIFYDSPGVHASALVFTGYARGLVLAFLEPFEGYNVTDNPTISKMGLQWFMIYTAILIFLHCLVYFIMSYFSFVFIFDIVLNTIFSFIASFFMTMLIVLIFNPE